MGGLGHVVERELVLVLQGQVGRWQQEAAEQVRLLPLGVWGGLRP